MTRGLIAISITTLLLFMCTTALQASQIIQVYKIGTTFSPDITYNNKTKTLRFFDIVSTPVKSKGSPAYALQLAGRNILQEKNYSSTIFDPGGEIDLIKDFPEPGLFSLKTDNFIERHSNIESRVITKTPTAYIVCSWRDTNASSPCEIGPGMPPRTFMVPDEYFGTQTLNYNGIEILTNPTSHTLASRLAVFDGGTWRMDRIGEFPDYYKGLVSSIRKTIASCGKAGSDKDFGCSEDDLSYTAAIIAYGQLMSGHPANDCLSELRATLPANYKPAADGIMADIVKQANNYAPLTINTYPIPSGK